MVRRIPAHLLPAMLEQRATDKAEIFVRGRVWVYVIHWQERGPTKVGIANDPRQRVGDLQVGNPFPLKIFTAFGFLQRDQAFQIESDTLLGLRGRAMKGEWLDATPAQVRDKVQECATRAGLWPLSWDLKIVRKPTADKLRAQAAMDEYNRLRS